VELVGHNGAGKTTLLRSLAGLYEPVVGRLEVEGRIGSLIDPSAGMQVRLSFAIATLMQPEVLLMDEWFSAGDADFMARAQQRLEELVQNAEILVLASHSMAIVRAWCTRAIRLQGGRIVDDGPVEQVLAGM
jgi:lipopolysaccharide transport system ATP-binding protein